MDGPLESVQAGSSVMRRLPSLAVDRSPPGINFLP